MYGMNDIEFHSTSQFASAHCDLLERGHKCRDWLARGDTSSTMLLCFVRGPVDVQLSGQVVQHDLGCSRCQPWCFFFPASICKLMIGGRGMRMVFVCQNGRSEGKARTSPWFSGFINQTSMTASFRCSTGVNWFLSLCQSCLKLEVCILRVELEVYPSYSSHFYPIFISLLRIVV